MPSEPDRADEIFAARGILEDSARSRPVFGIREIVAFFDDPNAQLSSEQTKLLFADAKLRDAFRRLKVQIATFALPMAAAASVGDIADRAFSGGRIRLRPSRRSGQSYLVVSYDNLDDDAASPSLLVLEGVDLIAKVALPAADDQNTAMIILDDRLDATVLLLLRDPRTSGIFK